MPDSPISRGASRLYPPLARVPILERPPVIKGELTVDELKALVMGGVPLQSILRKLTPNEGIALIGLMDDPQVVEKMGGVFTNTPLLPLGTRGVIAPKAATRGLEMIKAKGLNKTAQQAALRVRPDAARAAEQFGGVDKALTTLTERTTPAVESSGGGGLLRSLRRRIIGI